MIFGRARLGDGWKTLTFGIVILAKSSDFGKVVLLWGCLAV